MKKFFVILVIMIFTLTGCAGETSNKPEDVAIHNIESLLKKNDTYVNIKLTSYGSHSSLGDKNRIVGKVKTSSCESVEIDNYQRVILKCNIEYNPTINGAIDTTLLASSTVYVGFLEIGDQYQYVIGAYNYSYKNGLDNIKQNICWQQDLSMKLSCSK